ncbi:MAG TPA: helix-turn-helix domain-containing protein [Polyangiaceae bacterium]|nr:helix-turn-helix domain-containing protein [Polyangiaceae bacterium]
MDSIINAAALALAAGDPLAALQRVSLRDDPPALALRGIAMAQLGDLDRADQLLDRAARAFGTKEPRARARCQLARAEVALAARDLTGSDTSLERARQTLEAYGDRTNAAHARCLEIRRWLLLGHVARAADALGALDLDGAPPMLSAIGELLRASVALRTLESRAALAAIERAERAARRAGIPALLAEVEAAQHALEIPAARRISAESEAMLRLADVEALLASSAFIVDACRRAVRCADVVVSLARRPVLFSLARTLAEGGPRGATREQLILRAFGAKRVNDSHRARLRVELGRLRRSLAPLARVEATPEGFTLALRGAGDVCVLAPPLDHEHADVLALLADGERWSSSALALALGKSQRSIQRALQSLQDEAKAESLGQGRSQRWLAAPIVGFTTLLLLPASLPVD